MSWSGSTFGVRCSTYILFKEQSYKEQEKKTKLVVIIVFTFFFSSLNSPHLLRAEFVEHWSLLAIKTTSCRRVLVIATPWTRYMRFTIIGNTLTNPHNDWYQKQQVPTKNSSNKTAFSMFTYSKSTARIPKGWPLLMNSHSFVQIIQSEAKDCFKRNNSKRQAILPERWSSFFMDTYFWDFCMSTLQFWLRNPTLDQLR